jgi:hypothetical protein
MTSRTFGGLVIAAALALASTASADPPPASGSSTSPTVYAPCTRTPSKGEVEAAHGAYLAGRHSFDEGDYQTAITYFKDAYRRDCTKHELLPIIARAYELSQNRSEAIIALETYLKRVPGNDPNVDAIKKRIQNLRQADPKPTTSTATEPPPPSLASGPQPLPVSSPAPQAGESEDQRSLSPVPWVFIVGGGVGVILGTVLLVSGLDQMSTAQGQCPNVIDGKHICADPTLDSRKVQDDYGAGRSRAIIGGVVGGVSVVAIAGGIVWHVMDRNAKAGHAPRSPTGTIEPLLAPGVVGATTRLAF